MGESEVGVCLPGALTFGMSKPCFFGLYSCFGASFFAGWGFLCSGSSFFESFFGSFFGSCFLGSLCFKSDFLVSDFLSGF